MPRPTGTGPADPITQALSAAAEALRAAGQDYAPVTDPALAAERVGVLVDVLFELGSLLPALSLQMVGIDPAVVDPVSVAAELDRVHTHLSAAHQGTDGVHEALTQPMR